MKIILVAITCNSVREADAIGKAVLKKRFAACMDILPRAKTRYFWPPRSGKTQKAKGCFLLFTTAGAKQKALAALVRKLHSDSVPFIAALPLADVNPKYREWLRSELGAH